MRNLEMRLRWTGMNGASILLPDLGGGSPAGISGVRQGRGLLASGTRELGWDEAKRMIVRSAPWTMQPSRRWHAQTLAKLAETLEPTHRSRKQQAGPPAASSDR